MTRKTALILSAILLLGALCLSLPSCSQATIYSEGDGELNVLCTTFAPFDFTREVGGDRVTVSILQDSGADLHNYTPTAATLEAISQADIFIYVGGTSDENWVHDALAAAGAAGRSTAGLATIPVGKADFSTVWWAVTVSWAAGFSFRLTAGRGVFPLRAERTV